MRQCDSAYDRAFASATERTLEALRAAGHRVQTPTTGAVIVDGTTISPRDWDAGITSDDPMAAILDMVVAKEV